MAHRNMVYIPQYRANGSTYTKLHCSRMSANNCTFPKSSHLEPLPQVANGHNCMSILSAGGNTLRHNNLHFYKILWRWTHTLSIQCSSRILRSDFPPPLPSLIDMCLFFFFFNSHHQRLPNLGTNEMAGN